MKRRLELLEWARKAGALILEDDYDSEFTICRPANSGTGGSWTETTLFMSARFSKVLYPPLVLATWWCRKI